MNVSHAGPRAAFLAGLFLVLQAVEAPAALTEQELKCSAALAKNYGKLQTSILKLYAKCHSDDLSGKADDDDACDTLPVEVQEKVDKAKAKFTSSVAKACSSVCNISDDQACINDVGCPPRHVASPANNDAAESCEGKIGSNPFRIENLDWPGPYCTALLGHPLRETTDLGECLGILVDSTVRPIDEAIYASLDESDALTADTRKCVGAIAKAVPRAASRSYSATAACRDARRSANDPSLPPWSCAATDDDSIAAVNAEIDKMNASIAKSCIDTDIAALDGLCATGGGPAPTTVAQAQSCLSEMVREIATEERAKDRHVYSAISMLNVTHPQSATTYCGDGIVNPAREENTGVGEECDGSDTPCGVGGSCFPPGDLFECTCDNKVRERFLVNGDTDKTDSDAGWIGGSHDATHNDNFGYVTELSNCDCSAFTGATCTGSSSDQVCDIAANMAPRCTDDLDGTETCDERGNNNSIPENLDCFRCDDESLNPGQHCGTNLGFGNETVCQSQCFDDETDAATGTPCLKQEDCGSGQSCRGRCDDTITCHTMGEGSPLPLVSAATPVCVMLEYLTDISGTKNIVTGEQVADYTTRSNIRFGIAFGLPCPVCNGMCSDGDNHGQPCFGRCNASNEPCLLDADCTGMGDTTCTESAAECPGGSCSLDLRCSDGPNAGRLCSPDARTPLGVVSNECPIGGALLSNYGVRQDFGGVTTEITQLPVGAACTDPTWHNFTCPCPADELPFTGVPTRPNSCAGACDSGINMGKSCVTGAGGVGGFTRCVGGTDNNSICDEDADCEGGGTCSSNPLECTAGSPNLLGFPCLLNTQCGPGGVCSNPCPGAKCVPLCLPEGRCNGGARDGDVCSTTDGCKQCTAGNANLIGKPCDKSSFCDTTSGSGDGVCVALGGVTCDVTDTEDGICAAGPVDFRCNGEGYTTVPCSLNYGKCSGGMCENGSPSQINTACAINTDCLDDPNVPVSAGCDTGNDTILGTDDDIPGSGECEPRPKDCYVNNGFAEGGDTLNGQGDPTNVNVNAAFCTPPTDFGPINSASGFGGPSRIRRQGVAQVNVPSIP